VETYRSLYCAGKVVQLCGRSKVMRSSAAGSRNGDLSLVVAAVVLPLPSLTELIIDSSAFIMRLSVDLNVLHCDTRYNNPLVTHALVYSCCINIIMTRCAFVSFYAVCIVCRKRRKTVGCPSVFLIRRSTAVATAGGFAAEVGRRQQISIVSCTTCGPRKVCFDCVEVQHTCLKTRLTFLSF